MKKQTGKEKTTWKQRSLPFDRLSELPSSILQSILVLLPLRDMAMTSVLSKHWRYKWVKVPQLVFEDDLRYLVSPEKRYRYNAKRVFEILLKHDGPILKFTLDMTAWPTCAELATIIPFLCRNGIKQLTLRMPNITQRYKLSSLILPSLIANLVSLDLSNVRLDPNVSISSCPFLESLVLGYIPHDVDLLSIDAPNLKKLHVHGLITRIGTIITPLLKVLWLVGKAESYGGNCSSDFLGLLLSLPLLEDLFLTFEFLQVLAVGDAPDKPPILLGNLKTFEFIDIALGDMDVLTSALWIIRSSPDLRKIKVNLWLLEKNFVRAQHYLKVLDRSNYSLLKLQRVEMILSTTSRHMGLFIEFSKFLLEISPALETLYIEPDSKLINGDGYKKLFELACSPRASPKAKIVCAGLESLKIALV